MSLRRDFFAGLLALTGSGLDYRDTLACWSVAELPPDPGSGNWVSTYGQRVLEVVPGQEQYRGYQAVGNSHGKPAAQWPFGPRLRLRDGLDLSAATSLAYILVYESHTDFTQIIVEQSSDYDATLGRFITYIENGASRPTFHRIDGGYYSTFVPFAPHTPYVLGYRLQPFSDPGLAQAQTQFDYTTQQAPRAVSQQFFGDQLYVGARGGDGYPFRGKLSAIHLFRQQPSDRVFAAWLAHYTALYT